MANMRVAAKSSPGLYHSREKKLALDTVHIGLLLDALSRLTSLCA